MNQIEPSLIPNEGKQGNTACGSSILVTSDTPFVYYREEVVYFCAEDCKQIYDDDPLNSCMAARIIAGK